MFTLLCPDQDSAFRLIENLTVYDRPMCFPTHANLSGMPAVSFDAGLREQKCRPVIEESTFNRLEVFHLRFWRVSASQ